MGLRQIDLSLWVDRLAPLKAAHKLRKLGSESEWAAAKANDYAGTPAVFVIGGNDKTTHESGTSGPSLERTEVSVAIIFAVSLRRGQVEADKQLKALRDATDELLFKWAPVDCDACVKHVRGNLLGRGLNDLDGTPVVLWFGDEYFTKFINHR